MSLILVNKIWCVNFFFHFKNLCSTMCITCITILTVEFKPYMHNYNNLKLPGFLYKKQPKKMKVYNYYQWTNQSSRLTNFRIATRMLSISVKINPKAIHSKKNIRIQENVSFNLLKCLWDTFNWHLLVLTDNLFPLEFC